MTSLTLQFCIWRRNKTFWFLLLLWPFAFLPTYPVCSITRPNYKAGRKIQWCWYEQIIPNRRWPAKGEQAQCPSCSHSGGAAAVTRSPLQAQPLTQVLEEQPPFRDAPFSLGIYKGVQHNLVPLVKLHWASLRYVLTKIKRVQVATSAYDSHVVRHVMSTQ